MEGAAIDRVALSAWFRVVTMNNIARIEYRTWLLRESAGFPCINPGPGIHISSESRLLL